MLKRAGATIIGKTTTTAFAANDPTATLNPHNHGHTPGGSSSGSAAAVGGGMIPLALGTQTGGSVIRPASFCGAAAIKPTYRLLPTVGVKCFSWTLDTVGLFAAGVDGPRAGLSAMTGRPELLLPASIPAPRIGIVTQDFAGETGGGECRSVARSRARAAERAGASCALAGDCRRYLRKPGTSTPPCSNSKRIRRFAWEYRERYEEMAPLLRGRLDESRDIPPAEYDDAQRHRRACARSALRHIRLRWT